MALLRAALRGTGSLPDEKFILLDDRLVGDGACALVQGSGFHLPIVERLGCRGSVAGACEELLGVGEMGAGQQLVRTLPVKPFRRIYKDCRAI